MYQCLSIDILKNGLSIVHCWIYISLLIFEEYCCSITAWQIMEHGFQSQTQLLIDSRALGPVWSKPGSVSKSETSGCTVLKCDVYILQRSGSALVLSGGETSGAYWARRESLGVRDLWEESLGVPAVGSVGGYQEREIVQRSASEQTHMSPCIWYSKQMWAWQHTDL